MRRVLILGGTGEALDLAGTIARMPGIELTSALAGRTRRPRLPEGRVRIGGFGGSEGLARYLEERRIDLLIDATHPFATRISASATAAADAAGVPLLVLNRPPCPLPARAVAVPDLAAAWQAVPADAGHVLVTFRIESADAPHAPPHVTVRAIEPAGRLLPEGVRWRLARGPFALAEERRLLERLAIDVVIAKASGGLVVERKLQAADQLGLQLLVIARPPPPGGAAVVASVAEALDWLDAQRRGRST